MLRPGLTRTTTKKEPVSFIGICKKDVLHKSLETLESSLTPRFPSHSMAYSSGNVVSLLSKYIWNLTTFYHIRSYDPAPCQHHIQ